MSVDNPENFFLISRPEIKPDLQHSDCSQCQAAGYCKRNSTIDKSARDYNICSGKFGSLQRARFLRAWDKQTRDDHACCGDTPNVFDKTMSFVKAMMRWTKSGFKTATADVTERRQKLCGACPFNKDGECKQCGCNIAAKTVLATEACPLGVWHTSFEPLHRVVAEPVKHLIFHVYPKQPELLKWHADILRRHLHLFNGKRILGIATDESTLSIEETKEIFGDIFQEYVVANNNPKMREGVTYVEMLKRLPAGDNDITFFAHGKGVRHMTNTDTIALWTSTMYDVCLNHFDVAVMPAINEAPVVGPLKFYNGFRMQGHNSWHYTGTFFWFRNKEVFAKPNWKFLHNFFACVEAWPGNVFKAHEATCLWGDNFKDPYSARTWDNVRANLQAREQALCVISESACPKPEPSPSIDTSTKTSEESPAFTTSEEEQTSIESGNDEPSTESQP